MINLSMAAFYLSLLLLPLYAKSAAIPSVTLNEILPSPEGEDAKEEWIELFNSGYVVVELADWQIADTKGSIKTYTLPKNAQIPGQGFLILGRPQTKITLNNDIDGLQLIYKGAIVDFVEYAKAPKGQSSNKTGSGWVWSKSLTPGSKNIIPAPESKKTGLKIDAQTKAEKSGPVEMFKEKKIAAISGQIPKPSRPIYSFLTAFLLAAFSGAAILLLKKNLS
ncbi:MAG: lamin tail domain-containing protein [bacterium]|nr:lamin tail domain-containing protein [bacterium]